MPGVEFKLNAGKAFLLADVDVWSVCHLQVLGPGTCYIGDDSNELENPGQNNQRGLGYTQTATSSPNLPARIDFIGKLYAFVTQDTIIEAFIPSRVKGK